jgi:hypothetical protein
MSRPQYDTREKLQEFINKLASHEIDRWNRPTKAFKVSGPRNYPSDDKAIKCILDLNNLQISSLKDIQFPEVIKCTPFFGYSKHIEDVDLRHIYLSYNKLTSLDGVVFPPKLTDLQLQYNQITSLEGVVFPPGLVSLDLSNNQITSFAGMQFPLSLFSLKLAGNPIDVRTVTELKNPSPFVIREIVAAFPETGPHFQRMEEEQRNLGEKVEQLFKMLYALNMKKGGAKSRRKTCRKMKKM